MDSPSSAISGAALPRSRGRVVGQDGRMRFGLQVGYWAAGPPPGALEAVLAADAAGLDSVWTAEAYGSDAFTPLAWWVSRTSYVRMGNGVGEGFGRSTAVT